VALKKAPEGIRMGIKIASQEVHGINIYKVYISKDGQKIIDPRCKI